MSPTSAAGYRLRDLENVLSERGWSQADLARRSGLSAPTIGKAATAGGEVSTESAKKIAGALRVDIISLCQNRNSEGSGDADSAMDSHRPSLQLDPARMREAMAAGGMNPTEIAARAGVSVATVSSALRGLCRPNTTTIEGIASVLGKAPEQLCSGAAGDSVTSNSQQLMESSAGELRLVAGQSSTARYPEKMDKGSEQLSGPQSEVTPSFTACEKDRDQPSSESLGGILSHLEHVRQMVDSLLQYIGNLEAQVSRAMASEDEYGNGRTARSEGK